ncbi:hypothetical protein [Streptomyces sp. NPDC005799]|uniref:hypothetical protein n=1 Tax=Streptomyces sp. NPDC005799 TaxID=3154678 RepID=UPI0033EF235E
MPRIRRFPARRPRPAAILASGAAVIILGTLGTIGASDATPDDFRPTTDCSADIVTAYNAGWKAGVRDLGNGTAPTYPDVVGDANTPGTVAWADGWIDGQADALGDDNRDGRIEEDETGWDCHRMGNRVSGPQRDASHTSR